MNIKDIMSRGAGSRSAGKKILLSLGVIAIFSGYAIYQKTHQTEMAALNGPELGITTTVTPTDSPIAGSSPTPTKTQGQYKDGEYTGNNVDAFYGHVQVKAVVAGGKLTDVQFLVYPNDRHESLQISNQSLPTLKSEAIAAQSSKINIVSGATQTSEGFIESLKSALTQASA